MVTRYAYIKNGQTLWGPGPMPYFISLDDGTQWEITAHSVEESEDVGIFVVEQVNFREVDERFERANQPVYEIYKGRPREVWSYVFIPAAKEFMANAVDEYSESLRVKVATKFPGQYAEYDEAYAEAAAIMALPTDTDINPNDYPYVKADIGITYSPVLQRVVENIREAAETIVTIRRYFKYFGANLRNARLAAKKAIKEAETNELAKQIFEEFVSKDIDSYTN